MRSYLDLARRGENQAWRYFLSVVLILFLWQVVGSLPGVLVIVWIWAAGRGMSDISLSGVPGIDPVLYFTVFMAASFFFILGIFLAVRLIHQRPFLTLITPERSISWSRLGQGFAAWLLLAGLTAVLEAVIYPGRYVWSFDPVHFLPFLFLALLMIPIQTTAEELFFRAYLLQGFGLRIRSIWVLSAVSGFLFMVPHLLNPEASLNWWLMPVYYFGFGACLAYVTLRDGRLELALGVHAANNLFTAILANYTVTVLPTPSLFTVMEVDVVYSVVAGLLGMLVFVLLFIGPLRRRTTAGEAGSDTAVNPP